MAQFVMPTAQQGSYKPGGRQDARFSDTGKHRQQQLDPLDLLLLQRARWGVLENEGVQLVPHVHVRHVATRLALKEDEVLFDLHHGLWVAAAVALHILFYEAFKQLGQLFGVVRPIDDGGAQLGVEVGLRSQLAAKVLEHVC